LPGSPIDDPHAGSEELRSRQRLGYGERLGDGLAQLGHLSGFEASTGTIAVAGQHSSGDYSVELNNQNGGLPSPGRNGPCELAKAALLSQQCAAGRST
jgi:hypothetical protein